MALYNNDARRKELKDDLTKDRFKNLSPDRRASLESTLNKIAEYKLRDENKASIPKTMGSVGINNIKITESAQELTKVEEANNTKEKIVPQTKLKSKGLYSSEVNPNIKEREIKQMQSPGPYQAHTEQATKEVPAFPPPEAAIVDSAGISLIKEFEQFRDTGYFATDYEKQEGITTTGYGRTSLRHPDQDFSLTIDEPTASKYLEQDLEDVNTEISKISGQRETPLNENEKGALQSLLYNIGLGENWQSSRARGHLLSGDRESFLKEAFTGDSAYIHQDGKVLAGLVRRRTREADLFNTGPS